MTSSAYWKQAFLGLTLLSTSVVLAGCEGKEAKSARFAESGMAYLEEGDYESADLQFNNALFNHGQNPDALRGAAMVAKEQKRYTRQGRMLVRLLDVAPDDIYANVEMASLTLLSNEIERSREYANKVLEIEPKNISALTALGAGLVLENKAAESREVLKRAMEADPTSPEVYNLFAAQSIRDNNYEDAIAVIDEGLTMVEDPETLLIVRLILADEVLGSDEVIKTFERLIANKPESGTFRLKLAEYVLLESRDFDRAKTLFTDAIPYLDDPTEAYTKIVAIEREQSGDEAAERLLKGFVASNPEDTNLRFLLPIYFCQTGNYDACVEEFEILAADKSLTPDQTARAKNGIGDVAIVRRDFERAREISGAVLADDPRNTGAMITRGQVQLSEQNPEAAVESFRAALEGEPDNPEGLVFLALAYEASDQANFADAQFARALDQLGYQKSIVDQYRAFLIRSGDFDRSIEVLERYLRANPGDQTALLQRAEGAIAQGDFLSAEASARQLVTTQGVSLRAGSLLAQSLFKQERLIDALPITEQILEENPDDSGNKILRTSILDKLGRRDEAIAELRSKVEAGTGSALDYALLGDLLNNMGEHAEARRVSIEGLAKYPDAEQIYVLGYISESRMDNREGATAILRAGISSASSTVQVSNLLSNELIGQRRFDEAITTLRKLEEQNALTPLTANNLASLLLDKGDSDAEALEIARRLEGTENPYYADTLAWAYYKAGQTQNAFRYSRLAASSLEDNADVQYHSGLIELAMGNAETAREALEAARDLHDETTQTPLSEIEEALGSL